MFSTLPVGAFTPQAAAALQQGFTAINADLYVDGQFGYDGNPGTSQGQAFKTMAACTEPLKALRRFNSKPLTVAISGVLTEEYSTPIISDVTLLGAANQPRQATTSGVANGGGATWLSPTSGTGHLLTINGQAWKVQNLFFNNSATSGACILLTNSGDTPLLANAEHAQIIGCKMTGAKYGIRATGLPNHVTIQGNTLFGFSDSGDVALSSITGAGTGTSYMWSIYGNQFLANHTHVSAGLSACDMAYNHFSYINNGVTTTVFVTLSGGANNAVHDNNFDVDSGNGGIATMFVLGTNDRWYANRLSTAVATTQFSWGDPA